MATLFGIGMPGPLELAIVLGILLLLFGSRLPSLMRNLGRGVVEFKRGVHGVEDELEAVFSLQVCYRYQPILSDKTALRESWGPGGQRLHR